MFLLKYLNQKGKVDDWKIFQLIDVGGLEIAVEVEEEEVTENGFLDHWTEPVDLFEELKQFVA